VKCFKGKLVAQGFSQRHGVDYEEIFSPVACFTSICALLAFAAEKKPQVHQDGNDMELNLNIKQSKGKVSKESESM